MKRETDTKLHRWYLLIGGAVYALWWLAIRLLLPNAFNPPGSRAAVVALFFGAWALSYCSQAWRLRLREVAIACLWILTLHFFYLFYGNKGDHDWVIGSFVTLVATTYLIITPVQLVVYSVFVAALSAGMIVALPGLRYSVFFPGVLTILLQANVGLLARRRVLDRLRESNRRAEEERLAARGMQERVRALDEFIALASHELKTPITSMKLWMQLLERDPSHARAAEIRGLIGKQITRLSGLIETMLNTPQISSGKLALARDRVDLTRIVREAAELLKPESERAGTPFALTAPGPLYVEGDSSRLTQVVDNLLTNAIKYGNQKPVALSLTRENSEVVLRVEDRGIGIKPEHLERIFDRFERAEPSENVSGLGLGLFLVKSLVEEHGGTVETVSRPGEGSRFTVRLPTSRNIEGFA